MNSLPLIVIVGQTASGKSAAAMELALKHDGEIICADSRTIYKHADIGTAKPSIQDQQAVRHHMLDIITVDERYSAAQFKAAVEPLISTIQNTNKLPILVGGSGLYVDSVLFNFQFLPKADPSIRAQLQQLSVDQLQAILINRGQPLPSNRSNPVHLIRAIETSGVTPLKSPLRTDAHVYGLLPDPATLRNRSEIRTDQMLVDGLVDEAAGLAQEYSWDAPGLQAPAYKAVREHIEGSLAPPQVRSAIIKNDMHLAKRQKTWFKRNDSIQWYNNSGEIVESVTTLLNKSQ